MGTSKMRAFDLREARGDLGLEAEPVRRQVQRAREVATDRLVAGLHVREVQVGEHVAEAVVSTALPTECQK